MRQARWWRISFFLLPVVWMGVIFLLSAQPVLPGSEIFWQDFLFKKCAHMGVYMILFWTWFIAFRQHHLTRGLKQKTWLWLLLFCFLFALSDEWHQSFVPGRTATWRDIGFDMLGATLAFAWSYRLL